MALTFERATEADAEALLKAQVAAFHHDSVIYPGVELGGPPGYDSLESVLTKIREDDYYKIVSNTYTIGGLVVFRKGDEHFHLDLIFIDPAYHNQGIGTQAMQFLEETYAAKKWTLDTPLWAVRNHHFYEKLGYVRVGLQELEDITLIAYEKTL